MGNKIHESMRAFKSKDDIIAAMICHFWGWILMDKNAFWSEVRNAIAQYDLLKHPYYQAWTQGQLTKEDLRTYALQYYPHVEAFPAYLESLERRLPEGKLRAAIKENRQDELGSRSSSGISHSDYWLDFAYGMGANPEQIKATETILEIKELMCQFFEQSKNGQIVEALAAFYAYESQVPRIAQEKEAGLKDRYGADDKTCKYFSIHKVADIEHADTWKQLIDDEIGGDTGKMQLALQSVQEAAAGLWKVLDGIMPLTSAAPACVAQ